MGAVPLRFPRIQFHSAIVYGNPVLLFALPANHVSGVSFLILLNEVCMRLLKFVHSLTVTTIPLFNSCSVLCLASLLPRINSSSSDDACTRNNPFQN